jgi:hypothetical protein
MSISITSILPGLKTTREGQEEIKEGMMILRPKAVGWEGSSTTMAEGGVVSRKSLRLVWALLLLTQFRLP